MYRAAPRLLIHRVRSGFGWPPGSRRMKRRISALHQPLGSGDCIARSSDPDRWTNWTAVSREGGNHQVIVALNAHSTRGSALGNIHVHHFPSCSRMSPLQPQRSQRGPRYDTSSDPGFSVHYTKRDKCHVREANTARYVLSLINSHIRFNVEA